MSNQILQPGQTIGIIGGGQLGRMMALSAKAMGFKIAVLDPTLNSPCGQIADHEIVANYDDLQAIKELSHVSDVITYEFENISYDALRWLEGNAHLPQGSKLLAITQDRETEKQAIQQAGVEVAPYKIIHNENDLKQGITALSYPCVLKTCRGGYDGKGQVVIKTNEDVEEAKKLLAIGKCILEAWVPFEKEISVIVTRNLSGEIKTFPVAENIHVENILHQSIVPARITKEVSKLAVDQAIQLAKDFNLVGTLAVEMFLTKNEKIYINELAPRPHNSGHYTMEACETSQFEQHVRAVCNWPLGETILLKPVVMVNLLGEHVEKAIEKIPMYSTCKLHLYGKEEAKVKRKMGHINILTDNVAEALEKVKALEIWS